MTQPPSRADPTTLELYRLAVEMADRISARRATANSFFLAVQTAFVGVLGLATPSLAKTPWYAILIVAIAGLALSVSWWLQLRSYRDLNRAKFNVINSMETNLPHKIFTDEWDSLKGDPLTPLRSRYAELGAVERFVPWVFAVLYALLFLGRVA
jgi:hypothetical protein